MPQRSDEPARWSAAATLMARVASGDRSALAMLVRDYQRHVLDIANRMTGDAALAQDIAQETFLRVWKSASRYRPQAQFTTWLYRIVVNLCLDAFKRRRFPPQGEPVLAAAATASPIQVVEDNDKSTRVREAVDRLPERQRVAVILHRFTGLTIREVAGATGWSVSAVESLLVRAYAALRNSLEEFQDTGR